MIRLKELCEVVHIQEDRINPLPIIPKAPSTNEEVRMPSLYFSTKTVGAQQAWHYGITGNGWYVAVIDTGIRPTHEMFKGKNIVEQCFSLRGDCPNGQSQMSGPGAASHLDTKYEGFDHGTHVAGIAAGNTKNLSGVAKGADIIAIQVFSRYDGPYWDYVVSYDSDILKALEYIYLKRDEYKIAAINMSLGGETYSEQTKCDKENPLFKKMIDDLKSVGIATVVASGNDYKCNGISVPACISSAIAVGASHKNCSMPLFSNWHINMLNFFAPGCFIRSATGVEDNSYAKWTGTSMAAPHVTGAFALFKQIENYSVDKILSELEQTDKKLDSGWCGSLEKKPLINVGPRIFKLIPVFRPRNFNAIQEMDRAWIITEYFNRLSWDKNDLNKDKSVVGYRIYQKENNKLELLKEVSATTFFYLHRKVPKGTPITYAVTAVNNKGKESPSIYCTSTF